MLTFKKSLAGDLLARAYYLLGLRSHTEGSANSIQEKQIKQIKQVKESLV